MNSITIRNALTEDLDAVMRIEQEWPEEQRAGRDKFISRLQHFPQGFFLAEKDDRLVAVSTSTLVHYDPSDLSNFQSWERCTNNGYLYPLGDIDDYNALYIVSNIISVAYRKQGIREAMITAHLRLAQTLALEYTVTGAMMHGYHSYCLQNGEIPAHIYAFLKQDGEWVDPTLRKLASLGLILPDQRHIVENYYVSQESRNYGVILAHCNAEKTE